MSEAPEERITLAVSAVGTLVIPGQCMPYGDHDYVRADVAERWRRERDDAVEALKAISNMSGPTTAGRARALARVTIAAAQAENETKGMSEQVTNGQVIDIPEDEEFVRVIDVVDGRTPRPFFIELKDENDIVIERYIPVAVAKDLMQHEWQLIEDGFPYDGRQVLVCFSSGMRHVAWAREDGQWHTCGGTILPPTYWQPLPEPPQAPTANETV